jgi:NADP-dependent 3-hydroxy acid dehydrogenase YdfG
VIDVQRSGRVAVIIGASSGIGEASARAPAAGGHRVALLARRADRVQSLADEMGDGAIAAEQATAEMAIPAQDIAEVIAFAVSRPRRMALDEILVRPTAQSM